MSLNIKLQVEIEVPQWKYCNEQRDANHKSDNFCDFLKGVKDERNCKLFNKSLYSSYGWVIKCDDCITKSNLNKEENTNEKV